MNNKELIKVITTEVEQKLYQNNLVEIEASGRHIHLAKNDVEKLFGKHYTLKKVKELSQPGQFVCQERLTLVGPKGAIHNVVVLGPEREETQVEVSLTDAQELGISVPIRDSGDIAGSASITIVGPAGVVFLKEGLIVARSHIHMTPLDAKKFNLVNGELVRVNVKSQRPLIFENIVIRISQKYQTRMHIDYDEANACCFQPKMYGEIIKKSD